MKKLIILITLMTCMVYAEFHCMGCEYPYYDFSKECIEFATTMMDIVGDCEFQMTGTHQAIFDCKYGEVRFNKYDNSLSLKAKKNGRTFSFSNNGSCIMTEYDKYGSSIDSWHFNIRAESHGYKLKIYNYFKAHNIVDD